jgi:hypothetical protein
MEETRKRMKYMYQLEFEPVTFRIQVISIDVRIKQD